MWTVKFQVDAIVNSAGTELRLHRGASSRTLVAKGGKTLQEECDSKAPDGIKFGEVVVTSGGQLQCKYVIHGACCDWTDGVDTCKQVSMNVYKVRYITHILVNLAKVLMEFGNIRGIHTYIERKITGNRTSVIFCQLIRFLGMCHLTWQLLIKKLLFLNISAKVI